MSFARPPRLGRHCPDTGRQRHTNTNAEQGDTQLSVFLGRKAVLGSVASEAVSRLSDAASYLHVCIDAKLQPDERLDAANKGPGQKHRMRPAPHGYLIELMSPCAP